ncbi:hypothetical protein EW146_g3536 [Bondarzewia mesenterica]|uniref:Uncharacterized protein n=1 Tax=Bondarzewia mesenterica TaxID=1095465 RepID=A0A4V3XFE6_9AGAM|nr:hypothetical protein EW146_g3536 [Bondarzewia mesenterica]
MLRTSLRIPFTIGEKMPSQEDIKAVEKRTINILKEHGLTCCLMGSAASAFYGASRTPNLVILLLHSQDIDVVIMTTTHTQEEIKRLIVAHDSSYSLVPANNWRNSYKVLWHGSLGGTRCKVDILVPPTLNIPLLSESHIALESDVPVMPLFELVLLKLQGWQDHRFASRHRPDLLAKQHVDVKDINELLVMAANRNVRREDGRWLSPGFIGSSEMRVRTYVRRFPDSRSAWERLGFKHFILFLYRLSLGGRARVLRLTRMEFSSLDAH